MGPDRSLRQLAEHYAREGVGSRSAVCRRLERWSTAHNWADVAKQHDARVAEEAQRRIEELQIRRQVKDTADMIDRYLNVVDFATRPETLMTAAREAAAKGDFHGLAKAAVEAGKMAEVLRGGVSDRTSSVNEMPSPDDPVGDFLARFRKSTTEH